MLVMRTQVAMEAQITSQEVPHSQYRHKRHNPAEDIREDTPTVDTSDFELREMRIF